MIPIVFWASLVPWPRLYAAAETSCSRRKSQSTRPGWVSLKIHTVASIIAKPTVSPITGASTMKTPILISPAPMSDPNPAFATAAPAKPPINACDELVGNPQYHVIRSQTMAPTSPARIIHWPTTFDSTAPLPTVLVESNVVDQWMILAGLVGAIVWDLITWYWGLPTSSSHALIGGFAGAAVVKAGFGSLIAAGLIKIAVFMILAPLIGLTVGFTLMVITINLFKN